LAGGRDGWMRGNEVPPGKKNQKYVGLFLTNNDSPDYTQLCVCCFLVGIIMKKTTTEISFQEGATKRGSIGSPFC
jgi:hypothetical protein